jgi:hypothetical protein
MEHREGKCPTCHQDIPNHVLYQCISCYTKYCVVCTDSRSGKICPNCGQNLRMVLDQGNPNRGAA